MNKRLVVCILLANLLLSILVPAILSTASSTDEPPFWDDEWSFRKEIIIPINTSSKYAIYQPIDILINFDEPCWAKNEDEHSVRVCSWDGTLWHLLESQIYELHLIDENHIDSCNLVFLIPKEANGKEKYFVYYDNDAKPSPDFQNHVDILEDYYRYEQIPGLLFESSFYSIKEDNYLIYAVNKEGQAFNEPATQQVVKLKKQTENVKPNQGEQLASFDFTYWWYEDGNWFGTSTSQRLIQHQKLIDGNLMVKFGIVSESKDGLLKSTVIYKYYYCPTEDKRLYTHVKHEVINYPLKLGEDIDVSFSTLVSGGVKSNNIEELNFGRIPAYLHYYSEDERIIPFEVNQYPEGSVYQEVISKKDDFNLGSHAWVSVDDGETSRTHAIIFNSTNYLKYGTDEQNGLELQLYESSRIKLPGVDSRIAILYITRNYFEKGKEPDLIIPQDYVIEFDAEFYTSDNGGYPAVDEEAKLYQKLIQDQPTQNNNITSDEDDTKKSNLTAYVHFAPSFPFGSFLTTGFGKNVSYIVAELYKENSSISSESGIVSRISLTNDIPSNFTNLSLLEKIKLIFTIFDWKNSSFFKKISFPNIKNGRCLIKIFRENPIFGGERQFIGFAIVDLNKDKTIHIYCKPEGKIVLSYLNQNDKGIENVRVDLIRDNMIISRSNSDSNGNVVLRAPCGLREKYIIKNIYKGFLISEGQIRLGIIRHFIPFKKSFNFNVYDFNVSIRDSNNEVPSFDIKLSLSSSEMKEPVTISPDNVSDGTYKFLSLYPANYTLTLAYNSFEIKKDIRIPSIETMQIQFYNFTAFVKDNWNLSPGSILDVSIKSEDFEKNGLVTGKKVTNQEYYFADLYPGNYSLKIGYKSFVKTEPIRIPDIKNIEIIFPALFNVSIVIYDSRGNTLKDAEVLIIRENKQLEGVTNDNGEVLFAIPPGVYTIKIFSDDNLIAQRKIDVLNDNIYKIVTVGESFYANVVIGFGILLLIGVAFLSFKRKDPKFFLKILAFSFAFIAIISPWWAINGSSGDYKLNTSTKIFLVPCKMVTITSNDNVSAGEILPLDEKLKKEVDLVFTTITVEFLFIMNILPVAIIISFIFVFLGLILKKYLKNRLSLFVLLLGIIILIGSIVAFSYAMSELSNETVGSFVGNGNLGIEIPGEQTYVNISCSWGPSTGFYLLLFSVIILIFVFCLNLTGNGFKSKK